MLDRHQLTRQIAYGLYQHRGPGAGTAYGDWLTAEQLLELMQGALGELAQDPSAAKDQDPSSDQDPGQPANHDPADEALALLQAFVAEGSQAKAAKRLGYKSSSTVRRILRGQRQLNADLIERIQKAFATPLRKAG